MRAGIYVRISQDRTGAGLGVERQADDCQQLCEAKIWKVVEVYVDNDASAFSGKRRPEWERLLADIAAGEIDAVVGWHVDRLTRSPRELEDVLDLAERHGLELATVTGDIDLGTVSGRTFARMLGVMARNESEHKSERQRRANEQSAAAGKVHGGGMRPFGYAQDRRTVVPAEAGIVQECAERVLAGDSLRGVARELRARGAQTSAGHDWQPRSLRQVLLSARISGRRERHDRIVGVAEWPAIISVGDSDRLRLLLTDPARQTTRPGNPRRYLLSGLLRCGKCGAALVGRPQRGVPRYCCAHCGRTYTNAARTDEFLRDVALQALDGEGLRAALRAQRTADPKLVAEVARLRVKLEELAAAWGDDQMTTASYRLASSRVEARLAQGKRKLARIGGPDPLGAFVGSYAQMVEKWEELNLARRRAILDAVLAEVVVRPARSHWDEGRFEFGWKA